jgi:hypothetical protein
MVCGREQTLKRKASHRGHRGHRGGWRWLKFVWEVLAGTPWPAGENERRKEKHRTEAIEVTEGDGGCG